MMFAPDGFYNDWYGFLTNQTSHFVLGMVAFGLVAWLIGRLPGLLILALFYAGFELYQLQYSHDLADAFADYGFVMLGALFGWVLWIHSRKAMVAILAALGISLAVGVAKRRPKD